MLKEGFRAKLAARQEKVDSLLCVGLDPVPAKAPAKIRKRMRLSSQWKVVAQWMIDIVEATAPCACMFKLQSAHYEAFREGRRALQAIVDYIHEFYPDIPVFLDCKRGDIDRTQACYQVAHFELDGVDGMNFNPYMGKDCMKSLVDPDHPGRALVGLCYTSNSAAREVQNVKLERGGEYWEFIAKRVLAWAEEFGVTENAGLVMAAAHEWPESSGRIFTYHLESARQLAGNKLWFLIPGVGTQGGFVEETVKKAYAGPGSIAINSSSGIIFASTKDDYADEAGARAYSLSRHMRAAMQ